MTKRAQHNEMFRIKQQLEVGIETTFYKLQAKEGKNQISVNNDTYALLIENIEAQEMMWFEMKK